MKDRRGLRSVPPPASAPQTEEEDFALVLRFQQSGELAAFEALFVRHQQRVAQLCLALLRSQAEAEDAVQEVFLKIYRHLPSYDPQTTLRGWVYRIAVNHCRDVLERRARRAETQDEEACAALALAPPQEARLLNTMLFEAALAHLKPEARLAFTLQAVEGYSIAETAALLGLGYEAAASRVRRAYQQFAEAYQALQTPRTKEPRSKEKA